MFDRTARRVDVSVFRVNKTEPIARSIPIVQSETVSISTMPPLYPLAPAGRKHL